jgi:hypothetical protein
LCVEGYYASVGTLTGSSYTCAYFCQGFSDLCRCALFAGFIADLNWSLFIVLNPLLGEACSNKT